MKRLWGISFLLLAISLPLFSLRAGTNSSGGGDVFDLKASGEGYQFFDYTEYGESFDPIDLDEFKIVQERLDGLKKKSPRAAELLAFLFRNGASWSFVSKPELKNIPTTGKTNLIITYQKVQAAIADFVHNTIQINKKVWDELTPLARAFLMTHELLWIAEKAVASYQYINPDIQAVFLDKDIFEEASEIDWRYGCPRCYFDRERKIHAVIADDGQWGDLNHVNLLIQDDISTTSEQVRRMTGVLMKPTLGMDDRNSLQFIYNIAKVSTGKVNESLVVEYPSLRGEVQTRRRTYNPFKNIGGWGANGKNINMTPLMLMISLDLEDQKKPH